MSLCTPQTDERPERAGRATPVRKQSAEALVKRCSSRPTGSGGKRPTWAGGIATAGESAAGPGRAATGRMARRGNAHDRQGRAPSHRLLRAAPHETTIYIKHFLVPNRRAVLRQWVRRGKGRNEGKRSVHLATIGVPTITPVALGEQRKRKFLFENYLVTPAISDTIPLDEFVERRLPEWAEPERSSIRRKLARAVAVMTAQLHDAGLLHHDFHPGNILVRLEHADELELFMIDLDAMRNAAESPGSWPGRTWRSWIIIFGCRSSRTDRYRFLKTYLHTRTEPRPGRPICQANRRHDASLGGTAVAALGPAMPVVEQVLRGLSRAAHPVRGVARPGSV